MTIFIYGPPGSGKSTTGQLLAKSIDYTFIDMDVQIEKSCGMSISDIFKEKGETYFRDLETQFLSQLSTEDAMVVSLGGGTLLRQENRQMAEKTGKVVCFSISIDELLLRLKNEADSRPLLAQNYEDNLRQLMAARSEHYRSFPLQIQVGQRTSAEIAWEIQKSTGVFTVSGMGESYQVLVENGGLDRIGEQIKRLGLHGPISLVSDHHVAKYYAKRVEKSLLESGFSVHRFDIEPGEEHKTISTVMELWQHFLSSKMERKSTVVALGGGVVGDLTGFAAATFLRGVPWVNIPTSLLAMIDAGIGGKTGADLPQGKNLIGAFHAPRLVSIDPDTLSTLPLPHLKNGLAEVIKHGVIGDVELYRLCEAGMQNISDSMNELVRRAVAVKVDIIEKDPFEKNLRQVLNLGHSIGHAIETASNYRLLHGEAVGIGMLIEAGIAENLGIAEPGLAKRLEDTLRTIGLPTVIPSDIKKEDISRALMVDKKMENGRIRFPLPVSIGECRIGIEIDQIETYL